MTPLQLAMKDSPGLLLLSCSRRKNPAPGLLPAIERYNGPPFQVVRKWLRLHSELQATLDIVILSARFGLLTAGAPIPAYDQPITVEQAAKLRSGVLDTLRRLFSQRPYRRLCIVLGREYQGAVAGVDDLISTDCHITYLNGPPGVRLAQLHRWLYDGLDTEQQAAQKAPGSQRSRATIRGITLSFSPEQVIVRARQALATSPHPPMPPQAWYVEIDGQPVAPKWLVSQLSGLPVSAFGASEARRVLQTLGLEVHRR